MPDFDYAVAHFNTDKDIFNQMSYEETVEAQADMLITLEALRKSVQHINLEMADIELKIYGNSKDTFDNSKEIEENSANVNQRHTLIGL